MILVCGPKTRAPAGAKVINVTSRSHDFGKAFSPFFLGPVDLYGSRTARRFENAWQYAKVYKEHLAENGEPGPAYWAWAEDGWGKDRAERYPMGKGAVPEYSWWDGKKLTYVEARKRIYIPLYARLVMAQPEMDMLVAARDESKASNTHLWLWDFDGYDHIGASMTLQEVANNPRRKMGHAFVLAMLLDCNQGTTMATVERITNG